MCLSQESKSVCKVVITVCPEHKVMPHFSGDKLRKNSCLRYGVYGAQNFLQLNEVIVKKKNITNSVYDCTVEDVEYIYNKLSILIFNSKRRLSVL